MAAADGEPQAATKEAEKPKIEPLRLPTPEEIRGQDIWNNCAVRSVVSGIMGGGFGLCMGLFFGALDNPPMQEEMSAKQKVIYSAKEMGRRSLSTAKTFAVMGLIFSVAECVVEKARAKHDTTNTVVAGCVTGGAISAKGFLQTAQVVGETLTIFPFTIKFLIYITVVVISIYILPELLKDQTDVTHLVLVLPLGQGISISGPKAACAGCAGFAAFSVLIEKLFDRHD